MRQLDRFGLFLWKAGVFTDLGTTGFPGEVHDSAAFAINERGDLVGYDVRNFDVHAFVDKGGVRDEFSLADPSAGISATYPLDINARGQILSYATIPGGGTVVVRYAPVSSIPEPVPVLLWLAGLGAFGWRVRQHNAKSDYFEPAGRVQASHA